MKTSTNTYDVIVVGGGNAALCAALSARERGANVLMLERAPESERGGNSAYTSGAMRFAYNGAADIIALCDDLTPDEIAASDFGIYSEQQFFDDIASATQNRTDPELLEILVKNSNATLCWMHENGIKFMPSYGRQSHRVNGRLKFSGGSTIVVRGGGPGLVEALYKTAGKKGIEIVYGAWVRDLLHANGSVSGVAVMLDGSTRAIAAGAVILACGGFEANAKWRAQYLGCGWDLAKVRGTKYNTGDGLAMALRIGAQPRGHWSGCHAVGWDRYATDFGDLAITPHFTRHSYPFGIMVNADGKRFVDEGADLRTHTYAKYGHIVLEQPGQFAWQIYDSKVIPLLRDEYRTKHVTKVRADSIEELTDKMEDVNKKQLLATVREFNAAVKTDVPFIPNLSVKDGRCATGLAVPKLNWANTIDTPPFEAFAITCAITFTYGGIRITTEGQVVNTNHEPISGLFAAGEIVGGVYYFNCPASSGLTSGAVFGRLAGRNAADFAKNKGAQS